MKKLYKKPTIELETLVAYDVVCGSGDTLVNGGVDPWINNGDLN